MSIKITKGSDGLFNFKWVVKISKDPINLTGYTPSILERSPELDGKLTITLVNAIEGTFAVSLEGTTPLLEGRYWFRVRVLNPTTGHSRTSPRIDLEVY